MNLTSIQLPDGTGGINVIELPMAEVYRAVSRIDEIAIVNQHKAPELIACFARAFATLTDYIAVASGQVVKAKNALSRRTAIVLLDEVPRVLREKGLLSTRSPSGSEDQRNAVLEMDAEFIVARDRVQQLEAYYELLRGKQKDIEQAYLAVRKIIGDSYSVRNLGSSYQEQRPEPRAAMIPADNERPCLAPVPEKPAPSGLRASFGRARE